MKITITNDTAVALYMMLSTAHISRFDTKSRCAIVRITRSLRSAVEDYEGIRQEALERLAPVNAADRAHYNEEVNAVVADFLMEEREVDIPKLSVEAIDALCENNDFTTAQIILLEDTLKEN